MTATVARTAIIYFVVTAAIRLMGKRQIGDMQPNELVITLLISEIAAIPLQDSNQPVLNGIAAITVLIFFEIGVSTLALKSNLIRRILSGKAVILIKDGEIDQKAMKRVRVTVDDLLEMVRSKDVFDINEIEFAVLEVNGELNVLLKSQYRPVEAKDISLETAKEYPFLPVISDGKTVKENLKLFGLSKGDLKLIASRRNTEQGKIFLMLYSGDGKYEIIEKE